MDKKEFLKMIEKEDVDDTNEFWESVYDSIYLKGWTDSAKKLVDEMKKSMSITK